MTMMNIAFISEHASPLAALGGADSGGQNVYVAKLAYQLGEMGHKVDIFTRWDNKALPLSVNLTPNVRVIHVKAGPKTFIPKEELLPHMNSFTQSMLSFLKYSQTTYDFVHAHHWMSALVAADIKQELKIPFVVTFHALEKVRLKYQKEVASLQAKRINVEEDVIKKCNYVIAECPQDRDDLITLYNADPRKIVTIPAGFDQKEFYPIDRILACSVLKLDPSIKYVLALSRMVPRKGIETIVRGFARFLKDNQSSMKLLIVGGESDLPDPEYTPEIARLTGIARDENIEESVIFTGRKDRSVLKYFYSVAEVFASTPWYEPFGITPLEAMACGVPVIGTRVGGIKFTVKDNETGYLIEPQKPQQFTKALEALVSNPYKLRIFKENGVKHVNEYFTWEKVARQMQALYQKVLPQMTVSDTFLPLPEKVVEIAFSEFTQLLSKPMRSLKENILSAAKIIEETFEHNGKVMVCGNGGSAADAQHFATELVGRFQIPQRPAFPVMALTADSTFLTAWSNDVSFREVFSRQIEAFGQERDTVIGISTSGNSENVVKAFEVAHDKGMLAIGILGKDGGEAAEEADVSVIVPSQNPQRIQETHLLILHTLVEIVENYLLSKELQQRSKGMGRKKSTQKIVKGEIWKI